MAVRESPVEAMVKMKNIPGRLPSPEFWMGKRVLVTGHTGFKGGWLCLWLSMMGAKVFGAALEPPTTPNLFELAGVAGLLESDDRVDIVDPGPLRQVFFKVNPEIVFHLAARPIVRTSYKEPVGTFAVNSTGTLNVLEALKDAGSVKSAVMVTTDKVYRNEETGRPYKENDPLGGKDPYSASKACAEIIIESYRRSFFPGKTPCISSARAGNVIGGGDWSEDRLVPDAVKCFSAGNTLLLRNPRSVRPWQYVLDVLAGYLLLAEAGWSEPGRFSGAWNFAPPADCSATVEKVAGMICGLWPGPAAVGFAPDCRQPAEAGLLMLDSSKAHTELNWGSKYELGGLLEKTAAWYTAWIKGADMRRYSRGQIEDYVSGGL